MSGTRDFYVGRFQFDDELDSHTGLPDPSDAHLHRALAEVSSEQRGDHIFRSIITRGEPDPRDHRTHRWRDDFEDGPPLRIDS